MQKHTKLYIEFFGYDTSDFIPCEVCGAQAIDIHHIDARGMGGSKKRDHIYNLMALCRADHEKYGDKKDDKPFLAKTHVNFILQRKPKHVFTFDLEKDSIAAAIIFAAEVVTNSKTETTW